MTKQQAAEFLIKLEGGRKMPDGLRVYQPGEIVNGAFTIYARERIPCRGIELEMRWRTEGKGDEDGAVINAKSFRLDELPAGKKFGDQFAFKLPYTPHSYAGELISIVWMISLKIDKPLARDIHYHLPFAMAPAQE